VSARERFDDALRNAEKYVNGKMALCPAHDDSSPSLSISDRRDGNGIVIKCHAGCDNQDILAALGMSQRDLFDDDSTRRIYDPRRDYSYPDGRNKHRRPGKKFHQSGNTKGNSLFHADRIGDAQTVYWPEGEKDVEAVEAAGGVAVCSAAGAGKARLADVSLLHGKHVIVIADKDEPGRQHARQIRKILAGVADSVHIVEAAVGKDFADHFAAGKGLDELVPIAPDDGDEPGQENAPVELTRLADVTPERVSWLWPGRIPLGKLVMLDGDPGVGKSTVALDIAATITNGAQWADGTHCEHPGVVVIMSAEDGLADTIRPRLDAAGADISKVYSVDGIPVVDGDGQTALLPPTLADINALHHAITENRARLLIIDVLMAYVPEGANSHKDQDIRRVLSRLATLADETGCTILLLRHLNKSKGGDPLYRGGGSIGIVGAARAGLLVAADPDDRQCRILASVKSNLGPAPNSLAYQLVEAGDYGVARVQWVGDSDHTARDLLADHTDEDSDERSEAEQWLQDYLTEQGKARSKDAKADGAKAGIKEWTLKRAAKRLGVTVESIGYPRETWWTLRPSSRDTAAAATVGTTSPVPTGVTDNSPQKGPNSRKTVPTVPTDDDQHIYIVPTGQSEQGSQSGQTDVPTGYHSSRNTNLSTVPTGGGRPCFHCGAPTTAGQLDRSGRPAHLGCQSNAANLDGLL
jgi:putative DNA primase/helicase